MAKVINFRLAKLFRTSAPWESPSEHKASLHDARRAANDAILDRIRGVPANPSTEEDDNDPHNPFAPAPAELTKEE
ncbi:hypothetical protein [Bradyrhizobium sp. USDA 4452]